MAQQAISHAYFQEQLPIEKTMKTSRSIVCVMPEILAVAAGEVQAFA
jgi:hypothetical protein